LAEYAKWFKKRSASVNAIRKENSFEWKVINNRIIHVIGNKEIILTEKEGVAKDLSVNTMFIDSKGRLWMGSNKGLLTWNGSSIIPFKGMENKSLV